MSTSNILMIRPAAFAYNAETAVNNVFQQKDTANDVHEKALKEFDAFVKVLREHGVNVIVIQDTPLPHTPDAIFPNNWVSFHEDGAVVLYPMFAANRQQERNKNVLEKISKVFFIRTTIDLTGYENNNAYLEGTGSMVLDRDNELAYACLSPRTDVSAFYDFCDTMGYSPVLFNAVDEKGTDIYHTNVMMCMASNYVVICLDSIRDITQRNMLIQKFKETEKAILDISLEQMQDFAGNMLQVQNNAGEYLLVMSTRAYQCLTEEQRHILQSLNTVIHSDLSTIEHNGGGSARCMMAEIYLPLNL